MEGERACSVLSETLKIPFSTNRSIFFILVSTAISRIEDVDPLIVKVHIMIFVARCLLPLKMVLSSHKWVFTVFLENTAFSEKIV